MLSRVRSFLRSFFRRSRFEQEMADELRFHLDARVDDLIRSGLTETDARRRARVEFGGVEGVRDEGRQAVGLRWADELRLDVRAAVRTHRRSPALAAAVVLLLALGIGTATSVFAVVYGVAFRPLPVTRGDELVALFVTREGLNLTREYVSGIRFGHWQSRVELFTGMAASTSADIDVVVEGATERLRAEAVSSGFFDVLGAPVLAGRTFTSRDVQEAAGGAAPCLISERLWRRAFSSDPNVVGRLLDPSRLALTIVGVLPDAFARWREPVSVWLPYQLRPALLPEKALESDGWRLFRVVGRLRDGVTLERARAAMVPFDASVDEALREGARPTDGISLEPLRDARTPAGLRQSLWLFGGVTVLAVALVAASVAGLLLARSLSRRREMALRRAIGATTARLVRLVMTETALLAAMGGALGVVLANWAAPILLSLAPPEVGRWAVVSIDATALALTAVVTVFIVVTVGAIPALRVGRDGASLLRIGSASTAGPASLRAQAWLAGGQTAIALPVVVAATLLAAAFTRLNAVDPGFDPDRLLTTTIGLPASTTAESARAFNDRLIEEAATLPGTVSVAISTPWITLLSFETPPVARGVSITFENGRRYLNGEATEASFTPGRTFVSPGYFTTLGLRQVAGRGFTNADRIGAPLVAVVNEAMARMHWPGENPIGKRVNFESVIRNRPLREPWTEIVGVVSDARQHRFAVPPRPEIYSPIAQGPSASISSLFVRSTAPFERLVQPLRQIIQRVNPHAPVLAIRPMTNIIDEATAVSRYATTFVGLLAILALALAAGGVYGLGAFAATQRTSEVAIRMALGATGRDVSRLILMQSLRPAVLGLGIGAVAAIIAGRYLTVQLYEVSASNPAFLIAAVLVLAVVAGAASFVPARRATRVDPIAALKAE